ncbi:MAG: hypothetical protein IIA82_07665 [Thaumarchaeota archaeon]|nr:hypothetical protein [Nitrososphaerota archaeon]
MRRVRREGRAITKSFSYPKSQDEIIEEIEVIARREGTYFSDIVMEQLQKYVNEHSKSQNPQTEITFFETGLEFAIPNLYRDEENWKKFYDLIKKRPDYDELDRQLNMINNIHNRKLKEF